MEPQTDNIPRETNQKRMNLQAKLEQKRLERASKHAKQQVLDRTFKKLGIDSEKFKQDLEQVKKSGLTINMKN